METVTIKQVRSSIGRPKSQKLTLESLGLRKINQEVTHKLTPQIQGMIKKVAHLIEVVEKK